MKSCTPAPRAPLTHRLRTVVAAVAALGLAASLAACSPQAESHSSSEPQGPAAKVSIGISGPLATIEYAPVVLAQSLGLYKKHGLDVELQQFKGGSDATTALVGGSINVLAGAYGHTIQVASADNGQYLTAFAQVTSTSDLYVTVSPKASKSITSLKDLRGTSVGISGPGGDTDILLRYLLNSVGVPTASVHEVAIGLGATAVTAMASGQVDAAVMNDPGYSTLKAQSPKGSVINLVDFSRKGETKKYFGVDQVPTGTFIAKPAWLTSNPATAKALAAALQDALDWIQSHSVKDLIAKMPPGADGGDPAVYLAGMKLNLPTFAKSTKLAKSGVDAITKEIAIATPDGNIDAVDVSKTYTNKYVPGS